METEPKDDKLERLFAAARKAELYDLKKEDGFESRVMAKVRSKKETGMPFVVWTWRLIPVFVSLVVLLGIWISATDPKGTTDLSAVTGIGSEEAMLVASLTGE